MCQASFLLPEISGSGRGKVPALKILSPGSSVPLAVFLPWFLLSSAVRPGALDAPSM